MPIGTAAAHVSVMSRHSAAGTRVTTFSEPTVTISGSLAEVEGLTRIDVAGRSIPIDPARRVAHHDGHADPAIPFAHEGLWHLQVFLCGMEADHLPDRATIRHADGSSASVDLSEVKSGPADELETEIARDGGGGWGLMIRSRAETDLIIQENVFGREAEQVRRLPAGEKRYPILASHSERLGLCVSTINPYGGIEHKHLIYGEAGHASGRILAVRGRVYEPKVPEPFAYRSAIVVLDPRRPEWTIDVIRREGFDEAEIWCPPDWAKSVRSRVRFDNHIRVTTYAMMFDTLWFDADVVVVDPRSNKPEKDRRNSFLLFSDQSAPDFAERFEAAMRACATAPSGLDIIDRAWIGCESPTLSTSQDQYGIGFSPPGADTSNRITLTKRISLPERSPCGACTERKACDAMTATPWMTSMMPGVDTCRVRDAIRLVQPPPGKNG